MKLQTNNIESFLAKPSQGVTAALIYGPDAGLVSMRAKKLALTIVENLNDPFRVVDLPYATLKDDPARLADEINAMSLMGGRRLVRITDAATSLDKELVAMLKSHKHADSFVLICAGDLDAKSSLRKHFEQSDNAAAIPCYQDDTYAIAQWIGNYLRTRHYTFDADVVPMLASNFFGDRRVIENELEKLITYLGDERHVSSHTASLCVDDNAEASLDQLCTAIASRNSAGIETHLTRAFADGTQPIAVLRTLSHYFNRLHKARLLMATGKNEQDAMASLSPPVFFKQQNAFRQHLFQWHTHALQKVLHGLLELEIECKKTGSPAELLCLRFFTILPLATKR